MDMVRVQVLFPVLSCTYFLVSNCFVLSVSTVGIVRTCVVALETFLLR